MACATDDDDTGHELAAEPEIVSPFANTLVDSRSPDRQWLLVELRAVLGDVLHRQLVLYDTRSKKTYPLPPRGARSHAVRGGGEDRGAPGRHGAVMPAAATAYAGRLGSTSKWIDPEAHCVEVTNGRGDSPRVAPSAASERPSAASAASSSDPGVRTR